MSEQRTAVILCAVAVLSVVMAATGGVGASATASSASPHGAENGNYTVDLPFNTDHYPRDENPGGPYNASINQFAAGTQESYENQGAPDGLEQLKFLKIENQDIDFSECSSSNTAAFGIDRDNDVDGTEVDLDLLRYLEKSTFNKHSIEVNFYEGDELGAPDPEDKGGKEEGREDGDGNAELYPDDEIVSHQGYKSGGGPCYGMPEEPGWYQIEGFVNGTSWQGNEAKIDTISHYFYICVCDSEEEAIEQLGKRPSRQGEDPSPEQTATATAQQTATPSDDDGGGGGTEQTATATATATATPTDSPTPTPTDSPTPTPTDSPTPASDDDAEAGGGGGGGGGGGASEATATATQQSSNQQSGNNQQSNQQQVQRNQQGPGPATPTVGTGPGFGLVAALGGLAAAALLALRRD